MLLTIREVAERLKVSLSLAYRLVARGEIPSYEIASCKRVSEADLDAYLARRRSEGPLRPHRRKGRHF